MAESLLIHTMVAYFDLADTKDAYREALQEVIEAKVAGLRGRGRPRNRRSRAPPSTSWRPCGPASKPRRSRTNHGPGRKGLPRPRGESRARRRGRRTGEDPRKRKARHPA